MRAWAHNLLQRFRDQHPRAGELIDRAETTMAGWWQRIVQLRAPVGLGRRRNVEARPIGT